MSVLAPSSFVGLASGLGGLLGLSSYAPLLTALPIMGAIAAPLLLAGAFFLGRDKARKRDEKTRTETNLEAFDRIKKMGRLVVAGKIDGQPLWRKPMEFVLNIWKKFSN